MIEKMLATGDVWFAPMRDIAAHVRACAASGAWTPRREAHGQESAPSNPHLMRLEDR
jgi:hypothetical protein